MAAASSSACKVHRAYTFRRPVSESEGPGTIAISSTPARSTTAAVIGAGTVGTAVAVLLERAGHRVVAASGREATRDRVSTYLPATRFLPPKEAAAGADLVVLGVPDDHIASMSSNLARLGAFRAGQRVLHLSGSVGLSALEEAEDAGASVLSLHPLQSFPSVDEGIGRLPGSPIAVTASSDEGVVLGESLARDIGGIPFRLDDQLKPLYHAAAVFCSNYLVAVEGLAERLFRIAGLAEPLPVFMPLARTAFEMTMSRGPAAALTGPASRADVGTLGRNLGALAKAAPEAVEAYVALARVSAALALEAGRLSEDEHGRVEAGLAGWK